MGDLVELGRAITALYGECCSLAAERTLRLLAVRGHRASAAGLARALGFPDEAGVTLHRTGALSCARLGPAEWLLAGDEACLHTAERGLCDAVDTHTVLVTRPSDGSTILRLGGSRLGEWLAAYCAADLRPVTEKHAAMRVLFADVPVVLMTAGGDDEGGIARSALLIVEDCWAAYVARLLHLAAQSSNNPEGRVRPPVSQKEMNDGCR